MKRTLTALVSALLLTRVDGHLEFPINEILATTSDGEVEFIELYNPSEFAFDMMSMKLDIFESDAGPTFGDLLFSHTIPVGLPWIEVGDFYLIASDDGDPGDVDSFVDVYPGITPDATAPPGFIPNEGSYTVIIRDRWGFEIYSVFMHDGDPGDLPNDAGDTEAFYPGSGIPYTTTVTVGPSAGGVAGGMYLAPDNSTTGLLQSWVRPDQLTEPLEIHTPTPAALNYVDLGALTLKMQTTGYEVTERLLGVVERTGSSGDLIVKIESSDPLVANHTGSLVIPDGASTAPFTLTLVDDLVVGGPNLADITAVAGGHREDSLTISVLDSTVPEPPASITIDEFTYADSSAHLDYSFTVMPAVDIYRMKLGEAAWLEVGGSDDFDGTFADSSGGPNALYRLVNEGAPPPSPIP